MTGAAIGWRRAQRQYAVGSPCTPCVVQSTAFSAALAPYLEPPRPTDGPPDHRASPPLNSLRFMSQGESHKFMSQSERLKTGCTDRESRETSIPPSPRAPRPRGRERMGVPSLGFMDIRGILRKWKEQKRTNQKIENSKKKREIGNPSKKQETGNQPKNYN